MAALGLLLVGTWLAMVAHLTLWARAHAGHDLIHGWDDSYYFGLAHTLWVERHVDLTNELERLAPETIVRIEANGRTANKYGIGMPLMAAPAMIAGQALSLGPDADTMNRSRQALYLMWNSLLGVAGVGATAWLLALMLATLAPELPKARRHQVAAVAAAGLLLGSPLLWYVLMQPGMAHAAGVPVHVLLVWAWLRRYGQGDDSLLWPIVMGLAAGFLACIRLQDASMVMLIAMGEAVRLWMRSGPWLPALKEALAALAAAAIATLLALKPQIIYQRRLFGSLMIDGYGAQGEGFNWLAPQLYGVLFTTHNGLLPFHPLAALGLLGLGLGLLSRQHARVAAVFLAMVAINVYVQAAWWAWTMGTSFGARGLLNSWLLLTWGVALLLLMAEARGRRWFTAALVAAALCVAWSLVLFLLFYTHRIPHDGAGFDLLSVPQRLWEAVETMAGKLAAARGHTP